MHLCCTCNGHTTHPFRHLLMVHLFDCSNFLVYKPCMIFVIYILTNNNNKNLCFIMVKTNCSTSHMVYNRAAMTRHTDCHAGQQQQPDLAQRV